MGAWARVAAYAAVVVVSQVVTAVATAVMQESLESAQRQNTKRIRR